MALPERSPEQSTPAHSTSPGVSELGARLGLALAPRYVIERELGRGGMGVVYLGRDTVLERRVAIKVLRPELATAVAVERFLREARTLARLSHPHLVQVHDALEADGLPCITMDYVEGPTLRDLLAHGERLPVEQVRSLGLQLLDALAQAHALGIVHRDVKPANIFVVNDGARLVDFGIASEADAERLTRTGQAVGTADYMAPEQRDGRPVDGRTDVYALGLVLLEAVTGRRHAAVDARAWREVPRPVAKVLARAIEPDPARRWPDALAFRTALQRSAVSWTRRSALAIGVALAALAGLALALLSQRPLASATGDEGELAVLPVDDARDGELGGRLARLVVAELEPFPLVRVAPAAATRAWRDAQVPGSARALAPPGASRYVEGSLSAPGDTLHVDVRNADGRLFERFAMPADTTRLGELAHAVADSLVRKLSPRELQDFRNLSWRPAADVQATHAYFEGEDAFQRGDWADAEQAFADAMQRDPRFLQAAWGLMVARRFQRKPFGDVLEMLLQEREALPPFYRELLEAQLEPDLVQRFQRLEALVRSSGGSGEALLHYTNELFHRGALVGRPLEATLDTMSVLAARYRDMRHAATYELTIWGNVRLGRSDSAWQQFRRRAALVPDDDERGFLLRYAIWARFSPWKARLVRAVALRRPGSSTLQEFSRAHRLGLSMDLPADEAAVGRLLEAKDASRTSRESGMLGQVLGLMALGRPEAALVMLDSAAASMQSEEMRLQQLEWPVTLAALGLPIADRRVARARDALREARWTGAFGARARFTLGLDALAHRDTAAARALADTLSAAAEPVSARLGALLAARVAAARGAPAEALDRSRPLFVLDSVAYRMGPFARAATYLGRGDWQQSLGRWDAADREWLWYENADMMGWPVDAPQQGEVDAMLSGVARVRRAELAVLHGDPGWTCAPLARVADLWAEREPAWDQLARRLEDIRGRARCR